MIAHSANSVSSAAISDAFTCKTHRSCKKSRGSAALRCSLLQPTAATCRGLFSVLLCCKHRGDMGRKALSAYAKAKKLQNRMEASLPSTLREEIGTRTPTTLTDSSAPEISETQHSHPTHSFNRTTSQDKPRKHKTWLNSYVNVHGNTDMQTQPAPSPPAPSPPAPSQPVAPSERALLVPLARRPQSQQAPSQQPPSQCAPTLVAKADNLVLIAEEDLQKMSQKLEYARQCLEHMGTYARDANSKLSC